uniref:Uncharacterized protein n=1 Tax=Brassica campestris TaxID=3711 RepID=A0A3P5YII4_BRACM|nr:unnamed protein product [Brassica rapa]
MATAYERKRLENNSWNDAMMASLNVHAKASLLSASTKRSRDHSKSLKKQQKKKESEAPIVKQQSPFSPIRWWCISLQASHLFSYISCISTKLFLKDLFVMSGYYQQLRCFIQVDGR